MSVRKTKTVTETTKYEFDFSDSETESMIEDIMRRLYDLDGFNVEVNMECNHDYFDRCYVTATKISREDLEV